MRLCKMTAMGPSIKYVTLFLANFDPLPPPCHTLSHIPGAPPKVRHTSRAPQFLVGLVKKTNKSPLYKFSLNCSQGYLSGGLLSERFCPGWFLSIPSSVRIHLLQQKVKHHFRFHVSYV